MASNQFEPLYTGANLFDIYTDGFGGQISPHGLPGGGCNFVDLTQGANGAKCGCRRFWSRQGVISAGGQDQTVWCMCNHHACFHDNSGDPQPQDPATNFLGQENERPRAGRAPLSPVVDLMAQIPPIALPTDQAAFIQDAQLSFLQNQAVEFDYPGQSATPKPPPGSIPDTLAWGDMGQPPTALNPLPPIPSQCLMSQTGSTTSSYQARYLKPFAGKGLQTLSGVNGTRAKSPANPQTRTTGTMGPPPPLEIQTRDLSPPNASVPREGDTQQSSGPHEGPRVNTTGVSKQMFRNLSETVGGHAQRLDRLETISFSAGAHDDCNEKHDNVDLRVTELEGKIEEVEKMINDNGSVVGRRDRDDDASESVASVATSVASRALHSQELQSQLLALQAQVSALQSSLPSFAHPWEVEVVFLPFPLQAIWQGMQQFKNAPTANDDWTQLPMTYSTTTMRSQSPFYGDWAAPEHQDDWLLPKACSDSSIIDKRLRSRGLVRKVSVKGPDARSVQMAMSSVFGEVLRDMGLATRTSSPDPRVARFFGLQSTWVPLRKVHKDSRLRFLTPGEMLTPSMWDVQFLTSVMMRSSEPRLYVTHPDAYLQDHHAFETGWNWHKLRTMTRVYPDVTDSQEFPEADALEEYWAFTAPLDEPSSGPTSTAVVRRQRMSSSPSQQYFPAKQSWSSSSQIPRGASPALKGRRSSRPPHIRTNSMPLSRQETQSPASTRRRVASGGHSRRSTPSVRATASQSAVTKRRRARSPSHARFTPRWTASPSPVPVGLHERQYVRGTTPFAYATPHSNAPLQEIRPIRTGSSQPMDMEYLRQGHDDDDDGDFDIQIYESDSEGLGAFDDDGDSAESADEQEAMTHAQPRRPESQQLYPTARLPEDEPWPGIEDREFNGSDGENVDPRQERDVMNDAASDVSSQPSEYPSTQRAWPEGGVDDGGFLIHEDGDAMER